MPRIMNGLYRYGDDFIEKLKNKFELKSLNDKDCIRNQPNSFSIKEILYYFVIAARYIHKNIFYTYDFRWSLLFRIKKDFDHLSNDFGSFRNLESSRGVYWADPFVIAENDHYLVFVEEFIYKEHKAHISVLDINHEGKVLNSERIIERPYHMSYPFVFKIDGAYYLIPETSGNRTIELYKCIDFPYKWEFSRNIMEDLSAVDTTLFYHNNKWWLFTAIDQTENISGCSTELFLFFAEDMFSGNWVSHPCNPVVSDSRSARPAGKLFIENGKIYRPSQDCTIRYGRGFKINQVTKLTDTEYEEIVISEIEPKWDKILKGTYTYNFDKDLTVIDTYSFRKRFR